MTYDCMSARNKDPPHYAFYLLLLSGTESGNTILFLAALLGALCVLDLNGEPLSEWCRVEKEKANLFLLFFRGLNLQLLVQVLSDLPQLALGVRSEPISKFCAHDIDKLEKGGDEFLSVFNLRAGGDRKFDDDVLLAFIRE